jgi:hypothetical protein
MQTYASGSPAISSNGRITRTWLLRPVIWFPTAYTIVIIVHEGAHAVTAVALGFPSTLFNFWVNHQFTGATLGERAIVGAAGPTVSLILGTVCWAIYRRVKHSTAGLPVLFLAAHGVSNFFGNLMSAAFVGDFSNAAIVLGLSSALRYTASALGLLGIIVVLFAAGRELREWSPSSVGRFRSALGLTVAPMLLGTIFIIVVNQPTPMGAAFLPARLVEGSLWIFAAAGAMTTPRRSPRGHPPLGARWIDSLAAIAVTVAVRVMAGGIEM